ncbi:MAG: hypothetical protein R8M11_06605 [Gallionella sp.]
MHNKFQNINNGNAPTLSRWPQILFVAFAVIAAASNGYASEVLNQNEVAPKLIEEADASVIILEWDPYYTSVSINIPLTSKPIPTITSDSEAVIYRDLIEGSVIPRFMLLEASIYPLPVLGAYIKKNSPDLFERGQIGNSSINIVESVTAGFQEPWAVSAFFGNIAKLERPGEKQQGSNMGYTGYLFSAGSKHIKNNVFIDDIWKEFEWKIKGKLDYSDEKMSWSFRVGGKFHNNPDVTDVVYLGIFRSNQTIRTKLLRWLKNSTLDLKMAFSQHSGRNVRNEFVIGKKFPTENMSYTPTLDIGLIWDSPDQYSGVLRDQNNSTVTLLLRPSLEF